MFFRVLLVVFSLFGPGAARAPLALFIYASGFSNIIKVGSYIVSMVEIFVNVLVFARTIFLLRLDHVWDTSRGGVLQTNIIYTQYY